MSVKYHGKKGLVYLSASGTTAASSVGGMRGFTLDLSRDSVDVTEFGDTNRTYVVGFPAFQGTLDGFFATDVTLLTSAQNSADGTNIYLYPTSDAITKWAGGPAFLDSSIRTAVDQAVAVSANFRARGAWTNNL